MPQEFGSGAGKTPLWAGATNLKDGSDYKTSTGAYLILTCQIFNVAGTNYVESTDVAVWGKDGAKDIVVKIPNDKWEQGKRYVYTFTFTDAGDGGFDPEKNEPVLTPITLKVTVDDFVDGGNTDVPMDKPVP